MIFILDQVKYFDNIILLLLKNQLEEATPNQTSNNNSFDAIKQTFSSTTYQPQLYTSPPFPERLKLDKQIKQSEYDLLDELKNVCIKIPLLQAIKDIPIYDQTFKELRLKKPGRKKKDPQTIEVMGKLGDLMSGKIFMEKYVDLNSPIVQIHINKISIENTLIDLRVAINAMKKGTRINYNYLIFVTHLLFYN
jgi:hypothetical protein